MFLREGLIAYLRLNCMIRKKNPKSISEHCSSEKIKIDINRLRRTSQYHDVNDLGVCEDKIKTETLLRLVSVLHLH